MLEGSLLSAGATAVLLALLPLAVVPGFADIYGPIKQGLLLVLAGVALFAWAAHIYRARSLRYRTSWMLWLPIALLIAVLISAVASSAGYASWIGVGGQGYLGVFPFLAALVVYGLALYAGENSQHLRFYTFSILLGSALALACGLYHWFGLPSLIGSAGFVGFSPTGTFESLTILGAMASLFALGIFATSDHSAADTWMPSKKWARMFCVVGVITVVLTAVLMAVADTWPTQIVLLAGSGVFVALGLFDPRRFKKPSRVLAPMLAFAFALALLIAPLPWADSIPTEAHPGFGQSWHIGVETLKTDGAFGSGPGTFAQDFSRFKTEAINATPFWAVTFDRASSHFLTLFATWGLVPTLLYLAFLLWIAWEGFHALVVKRDREDWQTVAVLGSVWIGLVAAQFIYALDAVLNVAFWLTTGLLLAHLARSHRLVAWPAHGRGALVTALGFVATGALVIFALLISMQRITGEVLMARAGAIESQDVGSTGERLTLIGRATRLNAWHAGYARALALAHVQYINELSAADPVDTEAINHSAQSAHALAVRAMALNPFDARSARVLGQVRLALAPLASGMDVQALDAYRAARDLDPASPSSWIDLSRALLTVSDNASQALQGSDKKEEVVSALLDEAEQTANRAIELRRSAEALYTRALVLDRQGKLNEAIDALEVLAVASPQDAVLRFEIGVLQLRLGNKGRARQAFERALEIAPTYANAKWYLAALYEESGDVDDAIRQLEDLLVMNPDDGQVKARLELLKTVQTDAVAPEDIEPLP